jgi:hypothetical protein
VNVILRTCSTILRVAKNGSVVITHFNNTCLHNGGPWDAKNQVMYSFGIIKKISSYLFAYRIIIVESHVCSNGCNSHFQRSLFISISVSKLSRS